MVNPTADAPSRSASLTLAVTEGAGFFFLVEHVVAVDFEDERNFAGVLGRARLEKSERRRVCVASGVDGELKVIARVVGGRIDGEAARRAMLEALVHGQDHEFAGARELAVVEHPRQVAAHAGVFGIVIAQNLSNSFGHMPLSPIGSVNPVCTLYITASRRRSARRRAGRRLD